MPGEFIILERGQSLQRCYRNQLCKVVNSHGVIFFGMAHDDLKIADIVYITEGRQIFRHDNHFLQDPRLREMPYIWSVPEEPINHVMGHHPDTIIYDELDSIFVPPKKIKWAMLKVLEKKCWHCVHWREIPDDKRSYENYYFNCEINPSVIHTGNTQTSTVTWNVTSKVIEKESRYYVGEFLQEISSVDKCPCFSESQDYKDWKEEHPSSSIRVSHEKILL